MIEIHYTKSYKFRVAKTFEIELDNCPPGAGEKRSMPFAFIERRGTRYYLVLERDYGWDGATWAIDNKKFRMPSAVHDALLEMIGLGLLPANPWKLWADNFLIILCKRKKMWPARCWWVYNVVRKLGDPAGSKPRKIFIA